MTEFCGRQVAAPTDNPNLCHLNSRLCGNDEWGDAKALISRLLPTFAGITGDTVFIIF
jgi:hypothetical protein